MSNELTQEQIEFLNEYIQGTWTYDHKTDLVDVDGDFECRVLDTLYGIKFGKISGSFNCTTGRLTSLEGAPIKVGGHFCCGLNRITSLKGAPQEVGGKFNCFGNELTSLEGAPQEVGGDFDCSQNNLTSLEGAPRKVGGDFICHWNKITTLKGAPQEVGKTFDCCGNNLTSIEGAPQKVGKKFSSNLTKIKKYNLSEVMKVKKLLDLKVKEIDTIIHAICGEGSEEEIKLYLDLDDVGI